MKTIRVKEPMVPPAPCATVSEDASMDKALHQMLLDGRQSLLVTSGGDVVGY